MYFSTELKAKIDKDVDLLMSLAYK